VDETYGTHRSRDALHPAPARVSEPDDGAETGAALLDRVFERQDITLVRHAVQSLLTAAGFAGDRLQSFVLAVNEIITNAVLHAGGRGRVVLRPTAHSIWCTVTDSGPGIPARYHGPPEVPGAFEVGGRGLWLAYRLCDEVTMATGPIGTTIGLRMSRPGAAKQSGLVKGVSTGS
jgi:anti-sigma regulatory factor (Ser/Thr protein kinase)